MFPFIFQKNSDSDNNGSTTKHEPVSGAMPVLTKQERYFLGLIFTGAIREHFKKTPKQIVMAENLMIPVDKYHF